MTLLGIVYNEGLQVEVVSIHVKQSKQIDAYRVHKQPLNNLITHELDGDVRLIVGQLWIELVQVHEGRDKEHLEVLQEWVAPTCTRNWFFWRRKRLLLAINLFKDIVMHFDLSIAWNLLGQHVFGGCEAWHIASSTERLLFLFDFVLATLQIIFTVGLNIEDRIQLIERDLAWAVGGPSYHHLLQIALGLAQILKIDADLGQLHNIQLVFLCPIKFFDRIVTLNLKLIGTVGHFSKVFLRVEQKLPVVKCALDGVRHQLVQLKDTLAERQVEWVYFANFYVCPEIIVQLNVISIDFFTEFFIIWDLNIWVVFSLENFLDLGLGHFCNLDVEKFIEVD